MKLNSNNLKIALGWDEGNFDLNLFAIILSNNPNQPIASPDDIVYYNNLEHYSGAIYHTSDSLDGKDIGSDENEIIHVNTELLHDEVGTVNFAIEVFSETGAKLNEVDGLFVRIYDDNKLISSFEIETLDADCDSLFIAQLYTAENLDCFIEEKYAPFDGGLATMGQGFNVDLAKYQTE